MPTMTSPDGAQPQIYIPTLHSGLVREPVPTAVRFLDPGLPQSASGSGLFLPDGYAFSREEAARVLGELLAVGEALDVSAPTGRDAARAHLRDDAAMPSSEKAAIDRFSARAGDGTRLPAAAGSGADAAVAAHKVLLLAWDLEERLMEIARLRREVAEAVEPLSKNLRDPLEDDKAEDAVARALSVLETRPETLEPDWRITLAAFAVFLPEKALLVTAHEGIRAAMREAGMLLPLPEDVARDLTGWSENEKSALLWAAVPLWRLLGHSRAPANSPWLLAAPEIIVRREEGERSCLR